MGFSILIALPAYSQNDPFNRDNTSPSRTLLNEPIIRVNQGMQNPYGTTPSYPYGSRLGDLGAITTPRGQVIYPNVGVKNGDGSTTYYYPNGTSITIDKTKLPATGAILR
jgi:hypothetical protein